MPQTKTVTDARILAAALAGLEAQRSRIEEQIAEVRSLLGKGRGAAAKPAARRKAKRKLSATGRRRIILAQKRRWDAFRKRQAAAK
jgi:hypothetical protein